MRKTLRNYVKQSWEKAKTELKTPSFSVPYAFVPPCIHGEFRVLYYWDTYFTNVGLIADGEKELAKSNVNTLLFALNRFGCVPNCVRERGADFASQPPLLGLMIQDLYQADKDEVWLCSAVQALEKEYAFWMQKRNTAIGLNQYRGNTNDEQALAGYYDYVATRLHLSVDMPANEKAARGANFLAEGESGEDFTPRYERHNALDYVQIDLNAHLYGVEDFLFRYYQDKDEVKSAYYGEQKFARLQRIEKYCLDKETGVYYDYDFVQGKRSNILCAACFLPWFYGFGKNKKGLEKVYQALQNAGGVYACQDVGDCSYQWGYPNVWAPHQYFAYRALKQNGLKKQADALAENYTRLLAKEFEKTDCLWERYTPEGVAPSLEYTTQEMLGWTAGVYNYLYDEIIKKGVSQ